MPTEYIWPFSPNLPQWSEHRDPPSIAVRFTHNNDGKQVCCEIGESDGPGADVRSITPIVAAFSGTATDALAEATKAFWAVVHVRQSIAADKQPSPGRESGAPPRPFARFELDLLRRLVISAQNGLVADARHYCAPTNLKNLAEKLEAEALAQ